MINQDFFKKSRFIITYLIPALLYLQIIDINSSLLFAGDDQLCEEKLNQAEEHYYNGEFEKTIELVKQCLMDPSLTKKSKLRAYTILSRTLLAKNEENLAKKAVLKILEFEPNYQPTIEQETPRYVNLVTEVRKEKATQAVVQTKSGISNWILYSAGGVAAAAVIILLVSSSGSEDGKKDGPLPAPPSFPE